LDDLWELLFGETLVSVLVELAEDFLEEGWYIRFCEFAG
jgi:hypothetical protein